MGVMIRCALVLAGLLMVTGCAAVNQTERSDNAIEPVAESATLPSAASSNAKWHADLIGPVWSLVVIQSMDDREYVPRQAERFTIQFAEDGRVNVRVDCNRGMGTWQSEGPSQLRIGPLMTTRAYCPPPSLHDRFLTDLEYVRSYVMADGKLHLATMADGAILEFAPL